MSIFILRLDYFLHFLKFLQKWAFERFGRFSAANWWWAGSIKQLQRLLWADAVDASHWRAADDGMLIWLVNKIFAGQDEQEESEGANKSIVWWFDRNLDAGARRDFNLMNSVDLRIFPSFVSLRCSSSSTAHSSGLMERCRPDDELTLRFSFLLSLSDFLFGNWFSVM